MLHRNATFEMPDPETKIWRYMDFKKLVSMIDNETLYFTSIDNLNDPFEGSLTKINIEDCRKIISLLENNKFVSDLELYQVLGDDTPARSFHGSSLSGLANHRSQPCPSLV
jgi:hypothetical protein